MMRNHFDNVVDVLGTHQAYFPGTGGNISLKVDDGTMLIKASGKRILHMKENDGVVPLSYLTIKEYFYTTPLHDKGEKESGELVLSTVHKQVQGRPSIETGFHALLSEAVIHSHSAYVNMFACSTAFEMMAETLFLGTHISYLSIDYATPGYHLTHLFLEKVRKLSSRPKVIFMKNHGVVVSAPSLKEAMELHEEVNTRIKKYFGFTDTDYPSGTLYHEHDTRSMSRTPFLIDFVRNHLNIFKNSNDYVLFPDLTVFCQDIVVTDDVTASAKIVITTAGEIIYNTTKKEAHCIEENLIAFAFLLTNMKAHNLTPVYISQKEADSIRGMEQEKYRKRLLEK